MSLIRAFLALPLPDAVQSSLRVQQFLLPLPRAVDPDSFHLTLVFLGEVPDHVLQSAHERFLDIRLAPFDLALSGLGLFGGAKPRAAWAGVPASEPLIRLQKKLAHAAAQAGCAPEGARHFTPHVTLGRFAPPDPADAMRLERAVALGQYRSDPWQVGDFRLYQSHLTAKGPQYEELWRYDLR